jgi:ribosomal protein S27AE
MINDDNDLIVANRYCAMCGVDWNVQIKSAQGVASGDWKLLMINDDNDLIVANRYCAMCGVDWNVQIRV